MSSEKIQSSQDCRAWIVAGSKKRQDFRVGTEFERILIDPQGSPLSYDGKLGIRAVLEELARRSGWTPITEGSAIIGLQGQNASITLEPAGQFELSGAPLRTVSEMKAELDAHLELVDAVVHDLGGRALYTGINPADRPQQAPHMPKARYGIMRQWMPKVGGRGLDMMHLTCTVQANLDFTDAQDAMELLRAGFLVTPVLIALFANSPWRYGVDTKMASSRADLWLDVDPARCDLGAMAFDPSATVDDYVNWALDVPMYFVLHKDAQGQKVYRPAERHGATFGDFMREGDRGRAATEDDWALHLSTLFPDVRLKQFIELRGADTVPPQWLPAFPMLSLALLDDPQARKQVMELLRDGDSRIDRSALRAAACKEGLDGRVASLALRELATECLKIAKTTLSRRKQSFGPDPAADQCLEILEQLVSGTRQPLWQIQRDVLSGGANLWKLADSLS
ncbi:MAG TPA: glutamate--cysteine ligase [Myxococcales bacterium]|nr:glutamate--cysteine ligase [Myxococcales bacterium]